MKEMIKTIFDSNVVNEALDVYIPEFLSNNDEKNLEKLATSIANSFGISKYFIDILKDDNRNYEYVTVERFARNVKLLIEKTWVEQSNEFFKFQTVKRLEKLSSQLCLAIKNNENTYLKCFDEFCILLKEIVNLLFGKELAVESCLEYILRMEPNFGFFCYYIIQISTLKDKTEEHVRLAILIAIVFLSEF
ncbi:MAG: hypothetical protein ACTTKH_06025 [Treponema sp.]